PDLGAVVVERGEQRGDLREVRVAGGDEQDFSCGGFRAGLAVQLDALGVFGRLRAGGRERRHLERVVGLVGERLELLDGLWLVAGGGFVGALAGGRDGDEYESRDCSRCGRPLTPALSPSGEREVLFRHLYAASMQACVISSRLI